MFMFKRKKNNEVEKRNTSLAEPLKFAQYAKFIKMNGNVKTEHIKLLEKILEENYELDEFKKMITIELFRVAKNDYTTTFQFYFIEFSTIINLEDEMVKRGHYYELIETLYKIVEINNEVTKEQENLINMVITASNLDEEIIRDLKNIYLKEEDQKCYKILGCKKGDSLDVIKAKYKKLIKEYHPDKIGTSNIPEYLIEYSKKRFIEIREAYEYVCESLIV